jgi:hypothetical protein
MWQVDVDRCAWRQIGDRIVVLDLNASVYFELNPAAVTLWPRLVAGAGRTELVGILCRPDAGPAGRARVGAQVDDFVGQLVGAGLLRDGLPVGPDR